MNTHLRTTLQVLAFIAAVVAIWLAVPVQAHDIDCNGRSGIDLARCTRHQAMADKCGPLDGEAHFACDRDYLLRHPLDCKALSGTEAGQCEAEGAALSRCAPRAGREFLRCVRGDVKASPLGGL